MLEGLSDAMHLRQLRGSAAHPAQCKATRHARKRASAAAAAEAAKQAVAKLGLAADVAGAASALSGNRFAALAVEEEADPEPDPGSDGKLGPDFDETQKEWHRPAEVEGELAAKASKTFDKNFDYVEFQKAAGVAMLAAGMPVRMLSLPELVALRVEFERQAIGAARHAFARC